MAKREKPLPKRFWDDRQWANRHYNELIKKHPNEWIAIVNSKVVASGDNLSQVEKIARNKTRRKYIPVMFIEKGIHIYAIKIRN